MSGHHIPGRAGLANQPRSHRVRHTRISRQGEHHRDLLVLPAVRTRSTCRPSVRRGPEAEVASETDSSPVLAADPVVQMTPPAPQRLVAGRFHQTPGHPSVANRTVHPESEHVGRALLVCRRTDRHDPDRCTITLSQQPVGTHHARTPLLLAMGHLLVETAREGMGRILQRSQTYGAILTPLVYAEHSYGDTLHLTSPFVRRPETMSVRQSLGNFSLTFPPPQNPARDRRAVSDPTPLSQTFGAQIATPMPSLRYIVLRHISREASLYDPATAAPRCALMRCPTNRPNKPSPNLRGQQSAKLRLIERASDDPPET